MDTDAQNTQEFIPGSCTLGLQQGTYRISTNSYVRINKQFMQNKPKVKSTKINLNTYITRSNVKHGQLVIQTKQSQNKPN
jgi:hypothetical protein